MPLSWHAPASALPPPSFRSYEIKGTATNKQRGPRAQNRRKTFGEWKRRHRQTLGRNEGGRMQRRSAGANCGRETRKAEKARTQIGGCSGGLPLAHAKVARNLHVARPFPSSASAPLNFSSLPLSRRSRRAPGFNFMKLRKKRGGGGQRRPFSAPPPSSSGTLAVFVSAAGEGI